MGGFTIYIISYHASLKLISYKQFQIQFLGYEHAENDPLTTALNRGFGCVGSMCSSAPQPVWPRDLCASEKVVSHPAAAVTQTKLIKATGQTSCFLLDSYRWLRCSLISQPSLPIEQSHYHHLPSVNHYTVSFYTVLYTKKPYHHVTTITEPAVSCLNRNA